jgi:ATP/ADP translocase
MDDTDQSKTLETRFFRFLRIYPEERGIFAVFGLVFFCNALATQIASVAAVSGFMKGDGVGQIPIVWMIDMVFILMTAGLQSFIIDRFDRSKLVKTMIIGFAVIFLLLRVSFHLNEPGWLNYGLMLIISDQQWLFFPLVFWTLAQDIFSVAQAKRLFSPIASMGFIGQLTGLLLVSVAPQLLNSIGVAAEELLIFNVAIYFLAYLLVTFGLRKFKMQANVIQQIKTPMDTFFAGWDFIKEIPVFRYLAICILAVNLSLTFVEFGFLTITQRVFSTNYHTFYALYRFGLVLISFILQGLATSRIIQKLSLKNAFMVMPLALVAGSIWMLFTGIFSAIGGMVVSKVAQFTADDSARRSFQALVPEERRGRVSTFLESTLFGFGVIIASLLILGALFLGNWIGQAYASYIYRGLAVATGLWAVWAAFKMHQVYDYSMLNWRLKRRERSVTVPDKPSFH